MSKIKTKKKVNGEYTYKEWNPKMWKALGTNKRGWEEISNVSELPKINPAIERAEGLIKDGKLYEALELLTESNNLVIDAEVLSMMAEVEIKIGIQEEMESTKEINDSDSNINFDENLATDSGFKTSKKVSKK